MSLQPDVTVVVITYNDADRVSRAIRSVLRQTLRNLEVVVVDDASTDDTAAVVAAIDDPRVRYLRREVNSGGCGAPRNDGMAAARAPYLMFLDSDDELARHACKSLLAEIERTGADFVTGQIARLYEPSGRTQRYYPEVYARRRVVTDIRDEPDLFLDCFSTNKLYRAEFLRRAGLRFHEDLHYEDHLWSTQLFTRARRFAVVPWTVYLWHRAPEHDPHRTSISMSVRELDNVRQRVRAARLSEEYLVAQGMADLVPHRQYRFLRQDLRVYLNRAVPARDLEWIGEFCRIVKPYLKEISAEPLARADPMVRVCCHLILNGRAGDLKVAARSLTGPLAPPRQAVVVGGRTYWGTLPDPELEITSYRMAELPFSAARLRHEVESVSADGGRVTFLIRSWDPFGALAGQEVTAHLALKGRRVPLTPRPQPDGSLLSAVTADLTDRRWRLGHAGPHEPKIVFTRADGHRTADGLLVDPGLPPVEVPVAAGRSVTIGPYGPAATLRTVWRRTGWRRAAALLPRLRRRLGRWSARAKLPAYRVLIRVVPRNRRLALFEADCGKGYTGHPRYIYEEVRRRGLPLRAVWSVARRRRDFPADAPLVRRWSWRYLWTMARAGYWVDSHGLPLRCPKPRGTRYLQTWHGQGIKTIGFNAPDLRTDFAGPRERWRAAVRRWDALVAPSAEFERIFLPSNEYTGPVLRYGSPRCDVLVRGDPEAVRQVRERLEIPDGRRVLLYAPTYRDRARSSGTSVRVDLTVLAEALLGEWVMILRPHPVERFRVPSHVRHFVRPAGDYPEVNDLILASDALLTDYSSLMCDYAVTGRPMVFFIDDWEEYRRTERGVHHDLPAIAPGPCVTTTEELVGVLRDLDRWHEAHAERYTAFRALWCAEETGQAARRVVDDFFGDLT